MAKRKKTSSGRKRSGGGASRGGVARRAGGRSPWRLVARIGAWVAVLAAAAYAIYLAGQGVHYLFFTGNPHFTLERLEVHVTGRFTRDEVAAMLRKRWGIQTGQTNLFEVDPGRLRQGMLDHKSGLINHLTVRRQLPDTLELCIYERQPVARLGRRFDSKLIDGDGWILPPRAMGRRQNHYLLDLPVVTGIRDRERLETFTKTGDDCLLASLEFLRLCNANAYTNWLDVRLIRLDYAAEALHVYPAARGTFTKGAQIVVPLEGTGGAMRRVERIVRQRTRARQSTSHINATYEINVPVRP